MAVIIQKARSQHDIKILMDKGSDVNRYLCDGNIILRCNYTGSSNCCSNTRKWTVDNNLIMSSGTEINIEGKYEEGEINSIDKYFLLIVKKLENEDFSKKYKCEYAFDTALDPVIFAGQCWCWRCGRTVFFYMTIGIVVNLVAALGAFFQDCERCKTWEEWKRIGSALFLSLLVSIACNGIIGGLVGIYGCLCLDGREPWMILAGIGTGLIGTIPAAIIYRKFNIVRYVVLLVFMTIVAIGVSTGILSVIADGLKGPCLNCGGRCFLWTIIGLLPFSVLFISIFLYCTSKLKRAEKVTLATIIILISLVVSFIMAFAIGVYSCLCSDGTQYAFIIQGFFFPWILVAVFWHAKWFGGEKKAAAV